MTLTRTSARGMFFSASAFKRNIGAWEVDSVTSMHVMFRNAFDFSHDIGGWAVDSVTNMRIWHICLIGQPHSIKLDVRRRRLVIQTRTGISGWAVDSVRDVVLCTPCSPTPALTRTSVVGRSTASRASFNQDMRHVREAGQHLPSFNQPTRSLNSVTQMVPGRLEDGSV